MITLRSRISGGRVLRSRGLEISAGRNKQGFRNWRVGVGWKFGITGQQPAEILNTPIIIAGSKYFLKSCHIYLIHYLGNSTKVPSFCRFLLEKLKIYKWGP